MKSKILNIVLVALILFGALFLLSGCGEDNSEDKENKKNKARKTEQNVNIEQSKDVDKEQSEDDLYFKVLNNEVKYINESNEEMLFSEYMKAYEGAKTKVEYSLFDLDNDSENEMVILIESYDAFYLILNIEDGTVYGFDDVIRGMLNIKTDGTYIATGGATVSAILKCKFDKNKRITETLAEADDGIYEVNGKSADNAEFLQYLEEFKNKKDIEYTTFRENYDFI